MGIRLLRESKKPVKHTEDHVYSIVELWEHSAEHHGTYSLEMADAKMKQLIKKNPDCAVIMTQEKKKG